MATQPGPKDAVEKPADSKGQWMVVAIVSGVIMIFYFGFLGYMFTVTDAQEPQWTRYVYLLTGVEAIAFAAAGFLFGKEVHREQAQNAEKRAAQTEEGAANGRALSEVIQALTEGHRGKSESYRSLASDKMHAATQTDLDELAKTAKRLFP